MEQEEKLLELKKKVEQAKMKHAQLVGRLEEITKKFEELTGHTKVEEVEELLSSKRILLRRIDEEFRSGMDELVEEYDDVLES